MMNCIIKETGAHKCLYLEDRKSGIDYSVDFIGNAGDLDNFTWSDVHGAYIVPDDIFDWWHRVLRDQEILEDRLDDLREEYGSDSVHTVILEMPNVDLEDHAAVLHQILDEKFGEEA